MCGYSDSNALLKVMTAPIFKWPQTKGI